MTHKQRLLAALRGEPTDRLPWSPNLAYWWESQDPAFRAKGEVVVFKEFGCDPLIRGHRPAEDGGPWEDLRMYTTRHEGASLDTRVEGPRRYTRIKTPKGELRAEHVLSPTGDTWFLVKHPVTEEKDYEILASFFESFRLEPDYAPFEALTARYGDEALIIPMLAVAPNVKSGFQALVEYWTGTEQLAYDVYDYPETVEMALSAMGAVSRRAAELSAGSPAEAFITWEDTSTTNISPAFYERYILPEIDEWCDILHGRGKLYIQHACGHLRQLMPLMGGSAIDGIESISPPPTGNIELWDARRHMRDSQFLIGGIEPTVFLNSSLAELEESVRGTVARLAGTPFVLANSDSCPPGVAHEKFRLVSRIVGSL